MANYDILKESIAAVIRENGNQEITGNLLQQTLFAMVNALGTGYQFAGIASQAVVPGTPDAKLFYIAAGPGTYENFNNLVVNPDEIAVFFQPEGYSAWYKQTINVAEIVNNLIAGKADKVADAIADDFAAFDANGNIKDSGVGKDSVPLIDTVDNADFVVSDEQNYFIFGCENGEIRTKKFNSAQAPATNTGRTDIDLSLEDENGNTLAVFAKGNIVTKNFDSSRFALLASVWNKYKGKRLSILGDSISTFGDPDSRNQNGTYCYSYYPTETCRYSVDGTVTIEGITYSSIQFNVEDTYWMRLINATGMKLGVNESWRGSKVSGNGASAFNNQTRIDHLSANGTPDVILVYGGTNDAGASVAIGTFDTTNPQNYTAAQIAALPITTFADAYRTMLIRLMYKYPMAEIVVVLPTFTTSYYTIDNLDNYVELIKEACDFFGIKYIDARCTGINVYNRASYLVDGIHPNAEGMRLLFEKIYRDLIFT